MERWVNRVALVTGASFGIGKAVSGALVERGMIVYGCGRNVDQIKVHSEKLKSLSVAGSLHPVKCDLREEGEILSMFAEIKKNHGGVDVCINNAGLNFHGTLLNGETEKWKNIIDVNVLALSICTREAVKQMRERNVDDGHIINMNSVAGHRIDQNEKTHFYTGTKHMVTALTECLRQELRQMGSHIRASCISPGLVSDTDMVLRSSGGNKEYARKLFDAGKALEPKDVADMVVYVLSAPAHVEINDILVRSTDQKE